MTLLAVALSPALAACDSTQEKNERAKLAALREISGREPQRVTKANPDVEVVRADLVRGGGRSAVVVDLRSRAAKPITDAPIEVGVRRGSRTVILNAGKDLPWFRTHVPAIPAGGTATWVLSVPLGRRTRPTDRAVVRVGIPGGKVVSTAVSVPKLDAALAGAKAGKVRTRVRNTSGVTQFGLQLYAVAKTGDRYVAAGSATVGALEQDKERTVSITLTGEQGNAPLRVLAAPTIFR
ncbi:MAG: hypothetical protein JHC95_10525 [Solirubrobacteraceae bacterium]|nr:hypothetical protein [Solirubrobacteraceae bacterium]